MIQLSGVSVNRSTTWLNVLTPAHPPPLPPCNHILLRERNQRIRDVPCKRASVLSHLQYHLSFFLLWIITYRIDETHEFGLIFHNSRWAERSHGHGSRAL